MKRESKSTVLEMVLPAPREGEVEEPARFSGIAIGLLAGINDSGEPLVVFPGFGLMDPVKALSTVALAKDAIGRTVAVQFEGGDSSRPVILGVIQHPMDVVEDSPGATAKQPLDVELDGERMVFNANREIVLRCGKSSITLTRAGNIIIRGAYLLSRSSGVNRIKGGSVQIN